MKDKTKNPGNKTPLIQSKHKTTKLLYDNIRENLIALGCGDAFLHITSKTESMTEIIDKLSFITIKNLSIKDSVKRMRIQTTPKGKLFPKDTSYERLLFKYAKNS